MSMHPELRAGERTFHDGLYDWMDRAPWLAISAAAHLLVYFLLAAIPWDQFRSDPPVVVRAEVFEPVVPFEEPPEEPPEPPAEPVASDEPQLVEEDVLESPSEEAWSEVEAPAEPFDTPRDLVAGAIGELGLGGGGPPGRHFGPRGRRPRGQGGIEPALEAALAWLASHQAEDGRWDCDGFSSRCAAEGEPCSGGGSATHDVGVTGLALLAFLGEGNTQSEGRYRDTVARGLAWLVEEQDDGGLIGPRASHDFLYDHAIASLALCEAYALSRSPRLRGPAQAAIGLILRARNPYGAWRYDLPPAGDSDTSVTGWMVFALASAQEAGLVGDYRAAFEGALSFLDEVSDPVSGRVGYSALGEPSARTRANEHYPTDCGEAMTAVGLLCRIFLGETPASQPLLARHAERLAARPPVWDPAAFSADLYYWYYATYALWQMGKPWWPAWEKALKTAVVDSQRRDGDARGSWDPSDAWGFSGGRVYATAVMTLSLEVYFRYGRLLGTR